MGIWADVDSKLYMMQAVDHPYLVVHSASGATAAAAASAKAAAKAADDESDLNGGMCGVCHDPLEQPVNVQSLQSIRTNRTLFS